MAGGRDACDIALREDEPGAAHHAIAHLKIQGVDDLDTVGASNSGTPAAPAPTTPALVGPTRHAGPAVDIDRIPALVESFHAISLDIDFSVRGDLSGIDNLAGTTCNRVVQESMTNAHCHGQGVVELTIGVLPEEVRINCVNRVGNSDREQLGRGYGLIGMRERV